MGLAVQIEALDKSYAVESRFWGRRASYQALSNVHLEIREGEVFGLIGRNGYGKTTLIRCIAGLLAPTAGSIRVYGHDTVRAAQQVRKLIGWVGAEERSFYLRLTARQNLMFFARLQGMPDDVATARIDALSHQLQCNALLERRVHELSTGNRQRISIMRGLLHGPRLLILDEPTRSLDPFAADDLRRVLMAWVTQESGRSILITSHVLHEIEAMSSRIAIMGKGHLGACGTLAELRQRLGGGQRVDVLVRGALDGNQVSALARLGIEVAEETNHGTKLTLRRQPGDAHLNTAIEAIRSLGLDLEQINTVELSLQDIIDRVTQDSEHRAKDEPMSQTEVSV